MLTTSSELMNVLRVFLVGTFIRILYQTISISLHAIFPELLVFSDGLKAALLDPWYSLSTIKERCHLSSLYIKGNLSSISSSTTHYEFLDKKPVMLWAFMDELLFRSNGNKEDKSLDIILFIGLSILMDVLIAIQLFRIAHNVINDMNLDKEWELNLEPWMNPRIHPDHAWIFGLNKFGTKYQIDDEQNNQKNHACQEKGNNNSSHMNGAHRTNDETEMSTKIQKETILEISDIPRICFILYYLNPISILVSSTDPTLQGVQYLLLLSAFQEITSYSHPSSLSKFVKATFFLAVLTYLDIYYIVFLSPLIWCCRQKHYSDSKKCIGSKSSTKL